MRAGHGDRELGRRRPAPLQMSVVAMLPRRGRCPPIELERALAGAPYWPIFLLINPTAASNAASISKSVVSSKMASAAGRMGALGAAGVALVAAADDRPARAS